MKLARLLAVVTMTAMVVGCGGSKTKPQTPDGALRNIQESVTQNHPVEIFKALPASYRADIDALVVDAAQRMDAEIWAQSSDVLKQAVGLMKSKRALLLASPMMDSTPNKADIEKSWDAGISILEALVNSDFAKLDRLRKGNVEGLLAGDGAAIMAQVTRLMENSEQTAEAGKQLAKLKAMRVSVVSEDGDSAVVKVEAPDEEPEMVDMVRVEGVWIPREMADGFKEGIAETRKSLETMDFTTEEGKQKRTMVLMQLGAIKPMLTQLEKAKTQAELQSVFGGLMMGLMGGMNPGQ
jgi:hypothetical protein